MWVVSEHTRFPSVLYHSYNPFDGPNENPEAELPLTAGKYLYVYGDMDEDGFYEGIFVLICEFMLIHADSNQFICQTCSQFFLSSTTKSVAKITPIIIVLINRSKAAPCRHS